MEPAWMNVAGSNFRLGSYKDANSQLRPDVVMDWMQPAPKQWLVCGKAEATYFRFQISVTKKVKNEITPSRPPRGEEKWEVKSENGQWSKLRLSESRAMLASAMPSVSRFDVKHQWSKVNKNELLNDQTTNILND